MSRLSEDRFRDVFNAVEPLVESRYDIPAIIRDVPDPFHGDLDGAEIYVDYALGTAEAVVPQRMKVRCEGVVI